MEIGGGGVEGICCPLVWGWGLAELQVVAPGRFFGISVRDRSRPCKTGTEPVRNGTEPRSGIRSAESGSRTGTEPEVTYLPSYHLKITMVLHSSIS